MTILQQIEFFLASIGTIPAKNQVLSRPKHNTVGIGNCLQQPGHILNQRYTQVESFHPLIKFIIP
jgi:hypothetical protein